MTSKQARQRYEAMEEELRAERDSAQWQAEMEYEREALIAEEVYQEAIRKAKKEILGA